MLKIKKSVLMIIAIMLIMIALVVPVNSYASDGSINVIGPGSTPTPSVSTTTTPTTTPTPIATPTSTTNLPQTGIEDYTGLIVATVILGGTSIFAYKKIKEYNKF